MKVARIQNSLKDLNKDIGNCERQLSRVIKVNDSNVETGRSQNAAATAAARNVKSAYRQPNTSHISRSLTKHSSENQKLRRSHSSSKGLSVNERNIICKEVINKNATVEVVVRTTSPKKRSRSAQARRTNHEIPTRDSASRNKSSNNKDCSSQNTQKNASWGHIFQHQSSSAGHRHRNKVAHGKAGLTLHYTSSEEDQSSEESANWASSVPHGKGRSTHKSPYRFGSSVKNGDMSENYLSSFNPLRTLNFLVKELRGKVHKNCDENMQRIVEDMEKTLCTMSFDVCQTSPTAPSAKVAPPRSKTISADPGEVKQIPSKERNKPNHQERGHLINEASPNLVDRLLTTVSRITKITGFHENQSLNPLVHQDKQSASFKQSPSINYAAESVQTQLEQGCKQLEDTCRQMEETCKNLGLQKNQLLEDLKIKTQQLETAVGKNQQLTMYAADLRQEMVRVQQAAELTLQEHKDLKQKLLNQQREIQDSNNNLKRQLEETLQENQRLKTELQLCQLYKDKMNIFMSNKDLEVAKLKKEIVDINTLVAEQLSNIRSLSQRKGSPNNFGDIIEAFSQLHDTIDSANSTFEPALLRREEFRNHLGDGEGSRSRPICSSPTSSVNSSLYSSWHLMSDIMADNEPGKRDGQKGLLTLPKDGTVKNSKDTIKSSPTPVEPPVQEKSEKDESDGKISVEKSASELKAGLHDMFHQLKKQTSEAVNIALPSPPRIFNQGQETLGVSQWTELSASESTVLFHSSEESD